MKVYLKMAAAAVLCLAAAHAAAGEDEVAALHRFNSDTEAKIQSRVLDSVLGKGKAFAFLETRAEVFDSDEASSRSGMGEVLTDGEEAGGGKAAKADAADKRQKQTARQEKRSAESRRTLKLEPRDMKLRVLYSSSVPGERLLAAKDALLALFPGALKPEDIIFVQAVFAPPPPQSEAYAE